MKNDKLSFIIFLKKNMDRIILFVTTLSPVIAFAGSFVAIFISIRNSQQARKSVLVTAYVNSRIEHMGQLKAYMQEFLNEYICNSNSDSKKLRTIKSKIDLSIVSDIDIYEPLLQHLLLCIDSDYTQQHYQKLITLGQEVSNKIWQIIKEETGIKLEHSDLLGLIKLGTGIKAIESLSGKNKKRK